MQNKSFATTNGSSPDRAACPEAQLNLQPLGQTESSEGGQEDQPPSAPPMLVPVGKRDYAIVDAEDYSNVKKYRWRTFQKYAIAEVGGRSVMMHRFIMGDSNGVTYDHRNGFGLDNRRSNIRVATREENMRNRNKVRFFGRPDRPASSKYKGVSWRTDRHRWQAYIGGGPLNRRESLGCHATEELAAAAYNEAAIVKFGEFAKLNEIG